MGKNADLLTKFFKWACSTQVIISYGKNEEKEALKIHFRDGEECKQIEEK
jgi:hypothetical protein